MSLYKRGNIWWIKLSHRGRCIRRSTRCADKKAAKRKHDELAARLWKAKEAGRQLSDALLIWLDDKPRGASDERALALIRAEYHDRPLFDVDEASLLEAFGARKAGTYNRLIAVIRAALNMAHDRGWIEEPPKFSRRKEPAPGDRYLTGAQWTALRAELPEHLRNMAEFALATGLRWSNVANLEWSRVDFERRQAWIAASETKGGRGIGIPLSDAAIVALRAAWRAGGQVATGPVFTYRGRAIGSPKTAWRNACERAGVHCRFHDLRHTWASWHAMSDTPLAVIQQLGAWSDGKMVQRYAHLAPSHVAQFAGNALPPAALDGKQEKAA